MSKEHEDTELELLWYTHTMSDHERMCFERSVQALVQKRLTDLLATDNKPSAGYDEAQMRDFLLTTYTEYKDWAKIEYATIPEHLRHPTFDGYINYLRNSK